MKKRGKYKVKEKNLIKLKTFNKKLKDEYNRMGTSDTK